MRLGSAGPDLAVYGLDGERQAVLTLPPGLMAPGDYDPVWSADGASLMVPHGVKIPLDGTTPRKLPWAANQDALQEAYSADGSRVAYMIGGSFVVAAADGSNAQEVFGEFVWDPIWSPAGDRIAFTSGNGSELRVLDVATGTVTLLTEKDWPKLYLLGHRFLARGQSDPLLENGGQGHRRDFALERQRGRLRLPASRCWDRLGRLAIAQSDSLTRLDDGFRSP